MADVASLINELETTLRIGSREQRRSICEKVAGLFVAGSLRYSEAQVAVFDDVLIRLSRSIEIEARARLARHLAPVENAPRNVMRSLAADDAIAVAGPVLQRSSSLDDDDLVSCARVQGQAHLRAIAGRATLSEAVTDVLIERGDSRTVRTVARNSGARISENGFGELVSRANADDALARLVGMRADIPRHHFLHLLDAASDAVRAKLAAAAPRAREAIEATVRTIASDLRTRSRDASAEHVKAKTAAKRLFAARELGEADLHAGARAENFERVVTTLALLGRYPVEMVERALLDRGVEMILVLLKAAGCSRATAKPVLLMSVADRGLSPDDLGQALAGFDRLRPATAKRIVGFHLRKRKPRFGRPESAFKARPEIAAA
jgi:uncharacterized protein (DUF2336 family)